MQLKFSNSLCPFLQLEFDLDLNFVEGAISLEDKCFIYVGVPISSNQGLIPIKSVGVTKEERTANKRLFLFPARDQETRPI